MVELIGKVCEIFQYVSDLVWGFPTNFSWYKSLPVIGELPLVIILLVGTGIYFSFRLKFVQIRYFSYGIRSLIKNRNAHNGLSPLATFLLSTAMRVGPGNILGVTGAVSTGGPGALFWMWLSAFFGMTTAFVESTLSQIYKDRNGNEYVGGMPCYGRKLLGGATWIGGALGALYIIYAILCIPAQGFNVLSSLTGLCQLVAGESLASDAPIVWLFFLLLMIFTIYCVFGGLKRVSRITDILVPIMSVIYVATVLFMVALNYDKLPWFFYVVVSEAFLPDSVFGGALGITLSQGIKRGLMSNEAGQGTLTMPAAVADADHPCEQGCIQAIGVFLDTIVICTLTGFVVIMGQLWMGAEAAAWFELGRLPKFIASCAAMLGGDGAGTFAVMFAVTVCFGTFAFTSLLGFLSFSEVCAREIGTGRLSLLSIRSVNLAVLAFGMTVHIAGFDLSALWNLSDFANIAMVCVNLPLLYIGFGKAEKTFAHFERGESAFCSDTLGEKLTVWDEKRR